MKLPFLLFLCLSILTSSSLLLAQQPYVGKITTDCQNTENSTSALGYACNGQNSTCQTYLIFRSQPPYSTVSSISTLLESDPFQLSRINSVPRNATFPTNKQVIVPVNCSCSGNYYQTNSSYVVQQGDIYLSIANNTYQGLTTCQALQNQNNFSAQRLQTGDGINIPLRCACPTKDQAAKGVKYLLSYVIVPDDFVSEIGSKFGVDTESTLEANKLTESDNTIYPFTTLLVPLQVPPSSSQTSEPQQPPPQSQRPTSPMPPTPPKGKSNVWIYVVIGVVAVSILVLVLCVAVFFVFFRDRRTTKAEPRQSKTERFIESGSVASYEKPLKTAEEESEELLACISDIAQSLKVYKFKELQSATANFSPSCRIKGSVYRGTINGNLSAIKITHQDVSNEINILNKINHFNMIKLSGVSFHEGSWYLVFEYAANGALTDWIYSKNTKAILSWAQRVQIALDIASGLNYLQSYTNHPHVHKDIKSSNILLDNEFRAKIANFSLARSAQGQENEFALTRHIVGTKGYMAPEYLENGVISPKLDVYSLGVVMLEILTGKEAATTIGEGDVSLSVSLRTILHDENPNEKLKDFVDPALQENYSINLALFLARLIENCLRRNPADRPSMDYIVTTLSSISTSL